MNIKIQNAKKFEGTLTLPGDKSLSHRALMFGALCEGKTTITGLSTGADVQTTAKLLEKLGVRIERTAKEIIVHGVGLRGFKEPKEDLDCGNSGSTIRLMMGILAGQNFSSRLFGDASLSRRPMGRVAEPLSQMGARITLTNDRFAPMTITGQGKLTPTTYDLPVASAQVKSALLLAGLFADGTTTLTGKLASRDHTERMIPYFGGSITTSADTISIKGGQHLKGKPFSVPGDPSSAAFWLAAACIVPGGKIKINDVLLNPMRTGFQAAMKRMGAHIKETVHTTSPEPVGSLELTSSKLHGVTIDPKDVASLIDEIPMLAILATYAEGVTEVRGAEELRVKESDRIESIAHNLRRMGAELDTFSDGFIIEGPQKLTGAVVDSFGDHRIAMAFAIGALGAEGETEIESCDSATISYPAFFDTLKELTHG